MTATTSRSKFNVSSDKEKRTWNGILFDSKAECDFYKDWILPAKEEGRIVEYELQKEYLLQPSFVHEDKKIHPIVYRSDFYFVTDKGTEVVVDVKGMPTPEARLKRKMMWYLHPEVQFYWVAQSKKYGGWVEYDRLQKLRKEAKKKKEKEKNEKLCDTVGCTGDGENLVDGSAGDR